MATAMCLTGLGSAQAMDWNKDLLAQFQADQKDAAVVAAAPQSAAYVAEAVPQRTAEISNSYLNDTQPALRLILNNAKDKVGGTFSVCDQSPSDTGPNCETVVFLFPQLRYDAAGKRIVLGDELVATDGRFWGIQLDKSFKLAARIETVEDASGFDRVKRHFVKLYLVKTGR